MCQLARGLCDFAQTRCRPGFTLTLRMSIRATARRAAVEKFDSAGAAGVARRAKPAE